MCMPKEIFSKPKLTQVDQIKVRCVAERRATLPCPLELKGKMLVWQIVLAPIGRSLRLTKKRFTYKRVGRKRRLLLLLLPLKRLKT